MWLNGWGWNKAVSVAFSLVGVVVLAGCAGNPGKGPSPTAPYSLVDGVYTGVVVEHRHGPVQVQITVEGHRIVAVDAVQRPDESERSIELSDAAIIQLNAEVLEVQSTYIDFISGATMTSEAYVESLQDAIDQANQA